MRRQEAESENESLLRFMRSSYKSLDTVSEDYGPRGAFRVELLRILRISIALIESVTITYICVYR